MGYQFSEMVITVAFTLWPFRNIVFKHCPSGLPKMTFHTIGQKLWQTCTCNSIRHMATQLVCQELEMNDPKIWNGGFDVCNCDMFMYVTSI